MAIEGRSAPQTPGQLRRSSPLQAQVDPALPGLHRPCKGRRQVGQRPAADRQLGAGFGREPTLIRQRRMKHQALHLGHRELKHHLTRRLDRRQIKGEPVHARRAQRDTLARMGDGPLSGSEPADHTGRCLRSVSVNQVPGRRGQAAPGAGLGRRRCLGLQGPGHQQAQTQQPGRPVPGKAGTDLHHAECDERSHIHNVTILQEQGHPRSV